MQVRISTGGTLVAPILYFSVRFSFISHMGYFFLETAVDSGKALKAVTLFMDPTETITTPERQMLATPKYGKFCHSQRQ